MDAKLVGRINALRQAKVASTIDSLLKEDTDLDKSTLALGFIHTDLAHALRLR